MVSPYRTRPIRGDMAAPLSGSGARSETAAASPAEGADVPSATLSHAEARRRTRPRSRGTLAIQDDSICRSGGWLAAWISSRASMDVGTELVPRPCSRLTAETQGQLYRFGQTRQLQEAAEVSATLGQQRGDVIGACVHQRLGAFVRQRRRCPSSHRDPQLGQRGAKSPHQIACLRRRAGWEISRSTPQRTFGLAPAPPAPPLACA